MQTPIDLVLELLPEGSQHPNIEFVHDIGDSAVIAAKSAATAVVGTPLFISAVAASYTTDSADAMAADAAIDVAAIAESAL